MTLSRSQFPNGGWIFYQPQTRWSPPTPKASTFDQTVVLIMKHRMANPAITVKYRLATDFNSVANELEAFTRARCGIADESPKMSAPPSTPQMSGAVQRVVAAVKNMAAGAALLMEWEESGTPAEPPEVSENRASICVDCPQNDKNKSLTEYFTVPAADLMMARFRRLMEMDLTTSHDASLKVCQACLCPLRLKVHTPMALIQKRLTPEQKAALDPRCWILKAG